MYKNEKDRFEKEVGFERDIAQIWTEKKMLNE